MANGGTANPIILVCHFCGMVAPMPKFIPLAKPFGYEQEYNPVLKCPNPDCQRVFSPKA
jgi:hypothetical protein